MTALDTVLTRLGARQALTDFTYFVGRRETLRELTGGGAGNNFWIYGARRVGKSTIARRIQRSVNDEATQSMWVDLSDVTSSHFECLIERTLRTTRFAGAGDSKARFESLARTATAERPILVVYDEMDNIAPNLRADDQAFLRRVASENIRFNYLFISRGDPQRLVENLSDARSRLLGICNVVPVGALRERDVRELCKRVAADTRCDSVIGIAPTIWEVVGGHTMAVMTLLHAVVARIEEGTLTPADIHEAFARKKQVLQGELRSLWYDLTPATRAALLRERPSTVLDLEDGPLLIDGYLGSNGVIRPSWLVEVGSAAGLVPHAAGVGSEVSGFAIAERLHSLLYAINADLQRRRYPPGFETTSEMFRWGCLVREVRSEADVSWCVNHLAKIIYEGARHKDGERWRLPDVIVKQLKATRGYQELVALRNFWDHDPSTGADVEKPNRKFQNEGDVYEGHCGHRSPTSVEDWTNIRDGVVRSVADAVETVAREVSRLPLE